MLSQVPCAYVLRPYGTTRLRAIGVATQNDSLLVRQPLTGGILQADDVAGLVTLLLSDQGRAITGQVIDVDGGSSVADASGWPGPPLPEDAGVTGERVPDES